MQSFKLRIIQQIVYVNVSDLLMLAACCLLVLHILRQGSHRAMGQSKGMAKSARGADVNPNPIEPS